ncbi:MAG: glycosyltransferase family 2 protein [Candidatus Saccharimonadales bacterium]
MEKNKLAIVIPNWNGVDSISDCLNSLLSQSQAASLIVVDNGSVDGSVELIKTKFPDVILLEQTKNLGFAAGVNVGIKQAINDGAKYVALFNNDAVADEQWLKQLAAYLDKYESVGIATCKLMDSQHQRFDSTGDCYTIWGLPYPRGRGEAVGTQYDQDTEIFAASGGASLYRVSMLEQIGLFDESFFAYYEDVDLSFRAQLAGWKVAYVPTALAYHQIGATSGKLKGFTTYQTMKNLPSLGRKNIPARLLPRIMPRYFLAYFGFFLSAVARGQGWPATQGWFVAFIRLPKNFAQRRKIQKNRQVSVDYINKMLVHDLPPGATKLRKLRARWWKLTGRNK